MKKACIIILCIITAAFTSCNKLESPVSQPPEKNIKIVGTAAKDFKNIKWNGWEDISKAPSFKGSIIENFNEKEYTIIDAYSLNNDAVAVVENKNGEIEYFKISQDDFTLTHIQQGDILDKLLIETISDNDELGGFQRLNNYLLITKNDCTEIYEDNKLIQKINGIVKIQDIDGDGIYELICDVDGSSLVIYRFDEKKLLKLWTYNIQGESLNGNIQVEDLNNDGIKEIYIGDTSQNMRKLILTSKGFAEDNRLPIEKNGKETGDYFIIDYNRDGKYDVIVSIKNQKPRIYINKK